MGKDYDDEEVMKPSKKSKPMAKPAAAVKKPAKGCVKKK